MNQQISLIVLTKKTTSRYNPKVFRQHNRLVHA